MERFSDIRSKDIINISDGASIGHACDLIIDTCKGIITALIVPCGSRIRGFFWGGDEIVIPWNKVVKLGEDVILVELENCRLR